MSDPEHLHHLKIASLPSFCIWEGSIVRTKMLALVHALSENRPVRILDLGCGQGRMWRSMLEACPNIELYGVDPLVAGIDAAKSQLNGLSASIAKGDVRDMSAVFPNVPYFDFIVSHSVLEHVVPRHLFFPAVKSRLAPNGTALLSWGSDHFSQSKLTDIRNLVSVWLSMVGIERYFAKKVNEAWALEAIAAAQLKLEGRYFHSLVPFKKMYAKARGAERHAAFQHWITAEECLNRASEADISVAPKMDETFVVLTHA